MTQTNRSWVSTSLLFTYTFFILFIMFCILYYSTALAIKHILKDYIFVMAIGFLFGNVWYFRFKIYSFFIPKTIN